MAAADACGRHRRWRLAVRAAWPASPAASAAWSSSGSATGACAHDSRSRTPPAAIRCINFISHARRTSCKFVLAACLNDRVAGRHGHQLDLGRGLSSALMPTEQSRFTRHLSSPACARTIWRCASSTRASRQSAFDACQQDYAQLHR